LLLSVNGGQSTPTPRALGERRKNQQQHRVIVDNIAQSGPAPTLLETSQLSLGHVSFGDAEPVTLFNSAPALPPLQRPLPTVMQPRLVLQVTTRGGGGMIETRCESDTSSQVFGREGRSRGSNAFGTGGSSNNSQGDGGGQELEGGGDGNGSNSLHQLFGGGGDSQELGAGGGEDSQELDGGWDGGSANDSQQLDGGDGGSHDLEPRRSTSADSSQQLDGGGGANSSQQLARVGGADNNALFAGMSYQI
jgi:hypothetical protein